MGFSPSPTKNFSNSLFETSCLRDVNFENFAQNSKLFVTDFNIQDNMGTILEEINSQPSTQNNYPKPSIIHENPCEENNSSNKLKTHSDDNDHK